MTQDELVRDLHLLGYQKVSVGRVAEWRKLELLPPFTSAGEGQGRGAGRKRGYWSNPAEVLKQAQSIIELLKSYRRLEDLYLPLWQLGYSIPLDRVRAALREPLVGVAGELDIQIDGRSAIEDAIDDAVAEIMHGKLPLVKAPDDADAALSAAVNVVTNAEYKFDEEYEYGVSRLKEWEQSIAEHCKRLLGDSITVNPEFVGDDNNIFPNAAFINQHLSVPYLAAAVQTCTDEDLLRVQVDLEVGREILKLLKQLYELVIPYLPSTWRTLPNEMTVFFTFGRLFIWADLALREQGFGSLVDEIMPAILEAMRKDYEKAVKEITAVGPEIENAVAAFERLLLENITGDIAGAWRLQLKR
jgi:hypothetical protein